MKNCCVKGLYAALLMAIITASTFYGCSSSSSSNANEELAYVNGVATLDRPIVGATIGLYDENGDLFYEEAEATYKTGGFLIGVRELPNAFTIRTTGGTYGDGGDDFTGTLALHVDEHLVAATASDDPAENLGTCSRPKFAYYHLNPVTTLLSLYREKHPELSENDSLSQIIDFFDLHESTDINTDLHFYQEDFNPSAFMLEAGGHHNFDSHMQQLLVDIDTLESQRTLSGSGEALKIQDQASGTPDGLAKEILMFAVGKLFEGALSELGGEGMGWILDAIGLSDDGSDATQEQLDELGEKLDVMSEKLDDILDVTKRTQVAIQELSQQLSETTYDVLWNPLNVGDTAPIMRIEMMYKSLYALTLVDPGDSDLDEKIQAVITDEHAFGDVKQTIGFYKRALASIHNAQTNEGSLSGGLMEILGKATIADSLTTSQYDTLENQYLAMASVQIQGLNLLLELEHYRDGGDAQSYVDTYTANMKAQADIFLGRVYAEMVYGMLSFGSDNVYSSPYYFEWSLSAMYDWEFLPYDLYDPDASVYDDCADDPNCTPTIPGASWSPYSYLAYSPNGLNYQVINDERSEAYYTFPQTGRNDGMGLWVPHAQSGTLAKADAAVGSTLGKTRGTKVRFFNPLLVDSYWDQNDKKSYVSDSELQLATRSFTIGVGLPEAVFDPEETSEQFIELPGADAGECQGDVFTLHVKTFDFGALDAGTYWLYTTDKSYPLGIDFGIRQSYFFRALHLLVPITVAELSEDNPMDFTNKHVWAYVDWHSRNVK